MVKKVIFLIFSVSLMLSCKRFDKDTGKSYFPKLKNYLESQTKQKIIDSTNLVVYILYAKDCSCNDPGIYFAKNLINKKEAGYQKIVILKNDFEGKLREKLGFTNFPYINDLKKQLEKSGNIFRYDKIFVIKNGKFDIMFDIDPKNFESINDYFSL